MSYLTDQIKNITKQDVDDDFILDAVRFYVRHNAKINGEQRIGDIVTYLAPDRHGRNSVSINRPPGSLRVNYGLPRPHPDLPSWWWNCAHLKDYEHNGDYLDVVLDLHSYAGGGEMSDEVEFKVPNEWMTCEYNDLTRLIDEHAAKRRLEEDEKQKLEEQRELAELRARELAELERLQRSRPMSDVKLRAREVPELTEIAGWINSELRDWLRIGGDETFGDVVARQLNEWHKDHVRRSELLKEALIKQERTDNE